MSLCEIRNGQAMWRSVLLFLAGFLLLIGMSTAEASDFASRAAAMSEVKGIRISTTADKTRIVVDCSKEAAYKTSVLSNPQRIVLDVQNAWLAPSVSKKISVDSRFVKTVRVAQNDPSTVRIVIESNLGKNNIKHFTLTGGEAGYRIVSDFGNLGSGSSGSTIDFNSGSKPKAEEKPDKVQEQSGSDENVIPETQRSVPPDSDDKSAKAPPVVEPTFTPGLAGKVIALDAGHGGSDVGAIGPTGVTEKSVTLRIAKAVQQLLQEEEAQVLMTRTTDTEVSKKKAKASDIEELQARCDVANNQKADIFISIHMDSFTNSSPSGTTGYYYGSGTKAGQRLAKLVSEGIIGSIGTGNRGIKSCNFYVVKHTTMPATLVEVAFISNQREERLLNSEEGIKKAAQGIVNGLKKFFG